MSASRNLLIFSLVVFVFLLPVWRPWTGLSPQVRGLQSGVGTKSYFLIILESETSIVTFRSYDNNLKSVWDKISKELSKQWGVSLISMNQENNTITFEVGSAVTSTQLRNMLPNGEILEIKSGKSGRLTERIIKILERRLDPYGLLGERIRWAGDNLILIETSREIKPELLTARGRLEIFVDEDLAATPADILGFGKTSHEGSVGLIPVYFTSDGRKNFNSFVIGRRYSYIFFFLDRPHDGIVIFDPEDLTDLEEFFFDNESGFFVENTSKVAIRVQAFPSPKDWMSDNLADYLVSHFGEKVRIILLGSKEEFSDEFLMRIPSSYRIEFLERRNGETSDEWLRRALGFLIGVPVSSSLAENGVAEGSGINLPVPAGMSKAVDLRHILLNPLPAVVHVSSIGTVEEEKVLTPNKYFFACFAPIALFSLVVLFLSRSLRLTSIFFIFNFCMLIISLGLFSLLGMRLTPESLIAGVIIVSLSITCSLQILFEMLGGFRLAEGVQIGWRKEKALAPVYLWALIISLALIVVSLSGFRFLLPFSISCLLWLIILSTFGLPVLASMIERATTLKKEKT
ncbi:MAG: hypothetical protein QXF11_02965 [Candidatus Hadarchaeales archaeon]